MYTPVPGEKIDYSSGFHPGAVFRGTYVGPLGNMAVIGVEGYIVPRHKEDNRETVIVPCENIAPIDPDKDLVLEAAYRAVQLNTAPYSSRLLLMEACQKLYYEGLLSIPKPVSAGDSPNPASVDVDRLKRDAAYWDSVCPEGYPFWVEDVDGFMESRFHKFVPDFGCKAGTYFGPAYVDTCGGFWEVDENGEDEDIVVFTRPFVVRGA